MSRIGLLRRPPALAVRAGRVGFGLVLLAGAGVMVRAGAGFAGLLAATWLAAVAAYLAISRLAALVLGPGAAATDSLRAAGLVLPSVGVALLGPYALHAVAFGLVGAGGRDFDRWLVATLGVVGHALLVFVLLAGIRAAALIAGRPAVSVRRVFAIVVAVSCAPGILLFGIPPVVVAATGLPLCLLLELQAGLAQRDPVCDGVTAARARPVRPRTISHISAA